MLALAAAVRFLHHALFAESFFSPHYYLVDYAVLAVAAGLGYRRMRARQMVQQYGWSYIEQGLFRLARKDADGLEPSPYELMQAQSGFRGSSRDRGPNLGADRRHQSRRS